MVTELSYPAVARKCEILDTNGDFTTNFENQELPYVKSIWERSLKTTVTG